MIDTAPFEGFDWAHGSEDCFQTVRRYFAAVHGIHIRNHARPEHWWRHGLDLYREFARREGFEEVFILPRDVIVSDVFLIAIRSEVPNHTAIHVGNGMVLHHAPGRRSEVTEYTGLWRSLTIGIMRHKSLVANPPPMRVVDLADLKPRSFGT